MKKLVLLFGLLTLSVLVVMTIAQGQADTEGQEIYAQQCAVCHGQNGEGGVGPALAGNEELQNVEYVVSQILNGGGGMPAFAEQLTPEQIAAVATYERTSWGNGFGAATAELVRQIAGQGQAAAQDEPQPEGQEQSAEPPEQNQAEEQAQPEEQDTAQPGGEQVESPEQNQAEEQDQPEDPSQEVVATSSLVAQGEEIYSTICAACHRPDAQGVEGIYPPIVGNQFVTLQDPGPVIRVVLTGRGSMPSFRSSFSEEQVAAIVSYIRQVGDNEASAVSPQDVQNVKQSLGNPEEDEDANGERGG